MKQGWKIKKLGEVCKTTSGGTPLKDRTEYYDGGDIPWLRSGEVCCKYIDRTEMFITEQGMANSAAKVLPINTVLVAMYGATAGQVGILKTEAATNQAVCGILPNKEIIPEFLYYYFLFHKEKLVAQAVGGAQPNISQLKIKNTDIPIISLSEQHRIVKILDSAFAKIEALRANAQQNQQNTKDLFQASLKQELSPKQGWESKRLNEICEVKDGTHDSPKYVDDGIPFVTQKNITAKGFDIQDTRKITLSDHEKFYKRSNVEYGDILISMIGANRGMSCLVDVRDTFSIKNVGLVKQRDTIKQRYLLYYLQSPISAKYVADASNGGAQEFIGLTALRAFPILFPKNSEEQQTIVEKLDALSERCRAMEENYRQTITHCNALKQALLTKAFNGEL